MSRLVTHTNRSDERSGAFGAPGRFREVLVGTDFGPGGLAAIDLARRLSVPGGRMTLVHIVLVGDELAANADADEQLAAQARFLWLLDRERRLTLGCAAHPADLSVRTQMIVAGSVRRGLAHAAGRLGVDAVVVGARSRRRFIARRPDRLDRGDWSLVEAPREAVTSPAGRRGEVRRASRYTSRSRRL
jgi:nucleotide-binding universal stress UspA family protein